MPSPMLPGSLDEWLGSNGGPVALREFDDMIKNQTGSRGKIFRFTIALCAVIF